MDQHFNADQVNDLLNAAALSQRQAQRSPSRCPLDFTAIREQIRIAQVLELLDWKPNARHGSQLRGSCPLHKGGEKSQSFAVNVDRNLWYCHSRCQTGGNQIDLFAAATGLDDDPYRAAVELCEKLGIEPPYLSRTEKGRT